MSSIFAAKPAAVCVDMEPSLMSGSRLRRLRTGLLPAMGGHWLFLEPLRTESGGVHSDVAAKAIDR